MGMHLMDVEQLVPLLSLTGVVVDALGGLYLAYDLLGGKRGPLRLLSRLLTYSAILGLGYGVTLGLWFGLAGAIVLGPTIEYQLSRRARGLQPTSIEWAVAAALRGLAFGVAGWDLRRSRFWHCLRYLERTRDAHHVRVRLRRQRLSFLPEAAVRRHDDPRRTCPRCSGRLGRRNQRSHNGPLGSAPPWPSDWLGGRIPQHRRDDSEPAGGVLGRQFA
jgi:hypothetical protein